MTEKHEAMDAVDDVIVVLKGVSQGLLLQAESFETGSHSELLRRAVDEQIARLQDVLEWFEGEKPVSSDC